MMTEKYSISAGVVSQEMIAKDIFSMTLDAGPIVTAARPGQFVSLYSADRSRLLPRPVSICEADRTNGRLRLVYRIAGAGTEEFSRLRAGDMIDVIGPLGNGFPLEAAAGKRAILFGGGIGIPPMLALARALPGEKTVVLGYRDEQFLRKEFEELAGDNLFIATEDGCAGVKGNVLDCVREYALTGGAVYACGPAPMLRALKKWALEQDIPCYLSLEQRMACGIGACLACVCESTQTDEHSKVKNKRICAEGPVFEAREIEL